MKVHNVKNRRTALARRVFSTFLALTLLSGVTVTVATANLTSSASTSAPGTMDTYGPVNSITVEGEDGRPVTFYDIYGGETTGRADMTDQTQLYMDAVTQQDNLLRWLNLAYQIFESSSSTYWDHAGNGWDSDFGNGHYIDFIDRMQKAQKKSGDDASISSGLAITDSVKKVEESLAEDIASCIGRDLRGWDFTAQHKLDYIDDIQSSTPVIYSTVACVDRYGKTSQFGYNGFAVAFYDFQLHVIDDGQPLNTATGDMSLEEATQSTVPGFSYSTDPDITDGLMSLTTNYSLNPTTTTVQLGESKSSTVGTTTGISNTYSYGTTFGMSSTVTAKIPMVGTAGLTVSGNVSFNSAYQTSYNGQESVTTSESKTASTTITIPAHTAGGINETKSETTLTTAYDCPVGITYKVAIFSLCGTCYDNNAGIRSFTTAGYDQRSFITIFGDNAECHYDATEDIYHRGLKYKNVASYDQTYGKTACRSRSSGLLWNSLNWGEIVSLGKPITKNSDAKSKLLSGEDMINKIGLTSPMSVTGASTSCTETGINAELTEPIPLFPIKTIAISYQLNRDFILQPGESLPIYSYRVKAYDESKVEYYGFVPAWGEWKIVDANGNPTDSDVAEVTIDPVIHQQCVVAKAPGTTYVKYFINEGVYVDYNGHISTNSEIDSAAYRITVQDIPEEDFTGIIELTGEVEAVVDEPVNLNALEGVSVAVYDTTGKQKDLQVKWEAQELEKNGVSVTEDGVLTATQPGTYHVRAFYQDVYSSWIPVTAVEAQDGAQALVLSAQPIVETNSSSVQPSLPTGAEFDANTMLSRGEFLEKLHSLCGHPDAGQNSGGFCDVDADSPYGDCLAWAKANGIVSGDGNGNFNPDAGMTREQVATVLYNIAKAVGKAESLSEQEIQAALADATDGDKISEWAKEAVAYALQNGYLAPDENGELNGGYYVLKSDMADFMVRIASDMELLPDQEAYVQPIQSDIDETLGEP